jgi:hypothetical protein
MSSETMQAAGGFEAAATADIGFCDTMYAMSHTEVPGEFYEAVMGYGEDMPVDARRVDVPPSSRVPSFGSFGSEYAAFFGV